MTEVGRRCQRVIDTGDGSRSRCPQEAAWTGSVHAGRDLYVVESCDRHQSGLIDAEPLDGDWERTLVQLPRPSKP